MILRARALRHLERESPLLGRLRQKLLLTANVKDQLPRRSHARLWSKVELIIRERADRAHRDAVYLVEIITSRHELFLVHVSASLVFTVDTPFTWLLQLLDGLFLQHAIHDRSELAGRQQVFLFE